MLELHELVEELTELNKKYNQDRLTKLITYFEDKLDESYLEDEFCNDVFI